MYDMREVIVNYNLLAGQIKKELDQQFDTGRIKGTEYADVFNKLMSQAMSHAFESPLKAQQIIQAEEQTELIKAQKEDQEYVTSHIRPQEKMKILCDIDLCREQIEHVKAQEALISAQTTDQEYVTTYIRPIELQTKEKDLELSDKKMEQIDSDIALRQQQLLNEQKNLELTDKKIEQLQADIDIREQELLIKQEEVEIAKKKLLLAQADVDYKIAQTAFTVRQTEGFDDNKKQKMLDAQLNAWAMMFSSGLLDQVPSVINGCYVDSLYIAMSNEVGIDPSGTCQTPSTMSNNTAKSNARQGNEKSIVSKSRKRK